MNNFAKIVLVLLGIIVCFWVKETFFTNFHFDRIFEKLKINDKISSVKPSVFDDQPELSDAGKKIIGDQEAQQKLENTGKIYFLQTDKDGQTNLYISKREFKKLTLTEAVKSLLKGPTVKEEKMGVYSEIPSGTKLLGIVESEDKIVIDLNGNFQYGGGSESIDNRLKQLIKTVLSVSPQKDIYLYLDGKQVEAIGGDGVMLTQPLNRSDLGY